MKKLLLICLVVYCRYEVSTSILPGPLVYVVTPRTLQSDKGRSAPAPFYYHNWMRRMDPPKNTTTTTTNTPDLIFAEFESGNQMKSIRKLLEKEKIEPKTTTTARPIYVPDETQSISQDVNYGLPAPTDVKQEEKHTTPDMTDYFALYNNMYNEDSAPVYMPSTTLKPSTTSTTTTTTEPNVQNIWHIIDSQKYDEYSGKWEEIANEEKDDTTEKPQDGNESEEDETIDENFSLPGFGTNPGNGAENESRAIRTEPNLRFPYVSLKPFQVKTLKKPLLNTISSSKKGNNMFTNLDNFQDIKNPVRGEAQDVVPTMRQPIDRYNPAQPYLPKPDYGSNSKQSNPSLTSMKAVANLVPPPPPPPASDGDFPAPISYESFPPYTPSRPPAPAPPPPPAPKPMYQPPVDPSDDSNADADSDGPPMDVGYRYKPPSPPAQPFIPTLPPLSKPFGGYSYNKPPIDDSAGGGYSYNKPPMTDDSPPDDDKPDFQGYHYSKPEPPSYGPVHSYGPDYPELIYDKPHGGKGGTDIKDMVPPPPPPDTKPDMNGPDDNGFPHDFTGDLKFNHDIEDHDYHHYHHHHTTTTTTEMPRVNRYSYYYLGKKLYYLPLYFSVYFIVYVGALIIKAVLRHKIVYPNSWRPNDQTATFFSKRSVDSYDFSNENLHEITGKVTHAIAVAGEKYFSQKEK